MSTITLENNRITQTKPQTTATSSNWSHAEVSALFNQPFMDLVHQAQTVHRENFDPNKVQLSSLLSVKTGGCAEDCKYCPQSSHYDVTPSESMMDIEDVLNAARCAKEHGTSRFCMGAAWREPKGKAFDKFLEMVSAVKAEGLETCVTLGMLTDEQTLALKEAGLDYYNHNLDTASDYYDEIITTRTYQDRLDTLSRVRKAGMKVCCGGIVGMGENREQRIQFIQELANLDPHPESVPINQLVAVEGTPMQDNKVVDPIEFIRMIAVSRITMPTSYVRLSAGRSDMSEEMQALCFLAGANSIFYGEKLLTTGNPDTQADKDLLSRLGIAPEH